MHLATIAGPAGLAVNVEYAAVATAGGISNATVPAKKLIKSAVARKVIAVRCP